MKSAGRKILFISLSFLLALPLLAQTPETVKVPEGTLIPFWLKPQKSGKNQIYRIADLTAQIHQVTNGEFQTFLKSHPEWQKSEISPLFAESSYLEQLKDDLSLKEEVDPRSPVTSVSWFAARAYCENLQMRLPTIAEWEYLAAASEKKADANKEPAFLERILNWYGQPKADHLPKVKSIYQNKYGLYDLHGLVWEWVDDFNSNFMTGESREDSSFNRDLFCGAGSLNAGDKENYAAFMRFAFRASLKGNSTLWNLGFRCVKETSK
jgi:formylglycine-generating enzyme required for sulfatase activity